MAGFQILNDMGEGIVVYKPEGYKRYYLCLKDKKGLKHIASFTDDKYIEEFKDKLRIINILEV